MREFVVEVSENVTIEEIKETLVKTHICLCKEDYEDAEKNPETLLDRVCSKNGWKWQNFEFDLDMNFE